MLNEEQTVQTTTKSKEIRNIEDNFYEIFHIIPELDRNITEMESTVDIAYEHIETNYPQLINIFDSLKENIQNIKRRIVKQK